MDTGKLRKISHFYLKFYTCLPSSSSSSHNYHSNIAKIESGIRICFRIFLSKKKPFQLFHRFFLWSILLNWEAKKQKLNFSKSFEKIQFEWCADDNDISGNGHVSISFGIVLGVFFFILWFFGFWCFIELFEIRVWSKMKMFLFLLLFLVSIFFETRTQ